jgi:hypothetical protein
MVVDLQKSEFKGKPIFPLLEPKFTSGGDSFGGIGVKTISIDKPLLENPRKEIAHPGAAMAVLSNHKKTVIIDTIAWDTFKNQPQTRDLIFKIMTNLHVAIETRPGANDSNAVGIIRQDALFRIDCGKETGKRVIKKVVITRQQGIGMTEDKEIVVACTDRAGNDWLADRPWREGSEYGYIGGGPAARDTDQEIFGTVDDILFRTERYGRFHYKFKLPNGTYPVRLFFAETFDGICAPGMRTFTIKAGEKIIIEGFDIFKNAGNFRAVVLEKNITVRNGCLDLEFIPISQEPLVKAIEILSHE